MKTDRIQGIMPKQPKPLKIHDILPRTTYKHVKIIMAELPVQNQNLYLGHARSSQATGQKTTNPIVEELARRLKIDTY